MNIKHRIIAVVVGLSAVALGACNEPPQKEMAEEQKKADEKVAKAEKEAAEKTAKAEKEAAEKKASAAKDLDEKKAEVQKDLAEELADIKYNAFAALSDYKTMVSNRLSDKEKKFVELKLKGESKAATMTPEAKKEWTDAVATAEKELKQARDDLNNLDKVTEPTWSTTKARVDANVKNFAKSVDTLDEKLKKIG